MPNKIYTAFVSSVYESLLNERRIIIDELLDCNILPICMEHFIISDNNDFEDIKSYISECDFFFLILGNEYGSKDDYGISWTEKEYKYAKEKGIEIIAIKTKDCVELEVLFKESPEMLDEDKTKQARFAMSIIGKILHGDEVNNIVSRGIFHRLLSNSEKYAGWVRGISDLDLKKEEDEWQKNHQHLNLNGRYSHIHLLKSDKSYLRVGNITIEQQFNSQNYHHLKVTGHNYKAIYNKKDNQLIIASRRNRTTWEANYYLDENGKIKNAVYTAKKEDQDSYASRKVNPGERRGIHDFEIVDNNDFGLVLEGCFHDAISDNPKEAGKAGLIYVFRNKDDIIPFLESDNDFCKILSNIENRDN